VAFAPVGIFPFIHNGSEWPFSGPNNRFSPGRSGWLNLAEMGLYGDPGIKGVHRAAEIRNRHALLKEVNVR